MRLGVASVTLMGSKRGLVRVRASWRGRRGGSCVRSRGGAGWVVVGRGGRGWVAGRGVSVMEGR